MIQFDPSLPIYLQVVNALKKEIIAGRIGAGGKLSSGRDLALMYRINPNTSVRVYQELERQGVCFTKRGLGTFVREDGELVPKLRMEMAEDFLRSFLKNMEELGFSRQEIARKILEED